MQDLDIPNQRLEYVRINDNGVHCYVSKVVFSQRFNNDVFAFRSNSGHVKLSFSDFVVSKNGDLLKCRFDIVSILDKGLDVVDVL
jgi:hypothetical protein